MEDTKNLTEEQLDEVSAGDGFPADGPKKNLIRNLYDQGSELEKQVEEEIVKLEKSVADLLHPQGK